MLHSNINWNLILGKCMDRMGKRKLKKKERDAYENTAYKTYY